MEPVIGPVPPPRDWAGPRRAAEEALRRARGAAGSTQQSMGVAYEAWCREAEREVADATGTEPRKWGLRGKRANLRWESVLPEVAPKGGPSRVAIATWLRGTVAEMSRIASLSAAVAGEGMYIDDAVGRSFVPHDATYAAPVRGGYVGTEQPQAPVRGGRPPLPPPSTSRLAAKSWPTSAAT